ncbi:ATP-binding protein [Streptomyces mirabilis]|uniref:ATP-binding protein n=1 Tax=Streptomyces mirabilis TaxID=68239 RepID=UPI003F4CF4E3
MRIPGTPTAWAPAMSATALSPTIQTRPGSRNSPAAVDSLAVSSQGVALSVTDDGGTGTAPKAEHADQDATHGRGLGMVSAIAHRVLIHDSQAGHTVTKELFTSARPGGHPC